MAAQMGGHFFCFQKRSDSNTWIKKVQKQRVSGFLNGQLPKRENQLSIASQKGNVGRNLQKNRLPQSPERTESEIS